MGQQQPKSAEASKVVSVLSELERSDTSTVHHCGGWRRPNGDISEMKRELPRVRLKGQEALTESQRVIKSSPSNNSVDRS